MICFLAFIKIITLLTGVMYCEETETAISTTLQHTANITKLQLDLKLLLIVVSTGNTQKIQRQSYLPLSVCPFAPSSEEEEVW